MPVILAVDQGSSSSRCVVLKFGLKAGLDGGLEPVATASRPLTSAFPAPGRVEHDAGEILAGVVGAIGDALTQADSGWADVAGIGLAAQTETFVLWDRRTGQPVYPAISWRDTRGSRICAELRADGHESAVRSRTGLPLQSAFSASKLRWLLDELPEVKRAAASGTLAFGDINCWLIWQLSGGTVHVAEPSMAARTMLYDLGLGTWDAAMLDLFGIPAQLLPELVPTAGQLAVTDAAVCGGRARISASIGDQQAALFGQRCWRSGMAKLTLGTGAFLWCHAGSSPPALAPAGVVASCAWQLDDARTYALEGFVPNAGGVTSWLRQLGVLGPQAWPRIREGALTAADGPWCVPALFGLGTPRWTPATRAEIGGLTADSTGQDVAEAALIGVVHQVVDAIEAVRDGLAGLKEPGGLADPDGLADPGGLAGSLGLIRVDGGLAGNDSVLQAIADLSGLVLERPAATEITALGAGTLAGIGADCFDLAALARVPFEADRTVRPALPADVVKRARSGWQSLLADSEARWAGAADATGVVSGASDTGAAGPDQEGQ